MMRLVVRSDHDIEVLNRALVDRPEDGYLVELKQNRPPRTRPQNKKIHAMIDELGDFVGDPDIKTEIKGLAFWPTEIKMNFGAEQVLPKSESKLTKAEGETVIEGLYMIGAFLSPDGFRWSVE